MAFKTKVSYELIRKFIMVAIALPLVASSNNDCGGKAFHCVNSTHFMICVDLGSGVSSTIDSFVIPCPPSTVCQESNHFECEFPRTTTALPTTETSVTSELRQINNSVVTESSIRTTNTNAISEVYQTDLNLITVSTASIPQDFITTERPTTDFFVSENVVTADSFSTRFTFSTEQTEIVAGSDKLTSTLSDVEYFVAETTTPTYQNTDAILATNIEPIIIENVATTDKPIPVQTTTETSVTDNTVYSFTSEDTTKNVFPTTVKDSTFGHNNLFIEESTKGNNIPDITTNDNTATTVGTTTTVTNFDAYNIVPVIISDNIYADQTTTESNQLPYDASSRFTTEYLKKDAYLQNMDISEKTVTTESGSEFWVKLIPVTQKYTTLLEPLQNTLVNPDYYDINNPTIPNRETTEYLLIDKVTGLIQENDVANKFVPSIARTTYDTTINPTTQDQLATESTNPSMISSLNYIIKNEEMGFATLYVETTTSTVLTTDQGETINQDGLFTLNEIATAATKTESYIPGYSTTPVFVAEPKRPESQFQTNNSNNKINTTLSHTESTKNISSVTNIPTSQNNINIDVNDLKIAEVTLANPGVTKVEYMDREDSTTESAFKTEIRDKNKQTTENYINEFSNTEFAATSTLIPEKDVIFTKESSGSEPTTASLDIKTESTIIDGISTQSSMLSKDAFVSTEPFTSTRTLSPISNFTADSNANTIDIDLNHTVAIVISTSATNSMVDKIQDVTEDQIYIITSNVNSWPITTATEQNIVEMKKKESTEGIDFTQTTITDKNTVKSVGITEDTLTRPNTSNQMGSGDGNEANIFNGADSIKTEGINASVIQPTEHTSIFNQINSLEGTTESATTLMSVVPWAIENNVISSQKSTTDSAIAQSSTSVYDSVKTVSKSDFNTANIGEDTNRNIGRTEPVAAATISLPGEELNTGNTITTPLEATTDNEISQPSTAVSDSIKLTSDPFLHNAQSVNNINNFEELTTIKTLRGSNNDNFLNQHITPITDTQMQGTYNVNNTLMDLIFNTSVYHLEKNTTANENKNEVNDLSQFSSTTSSSSTAWNRSNTSNQIGSGDGNEAKILNGADSIKTEGINASVIQPTEHTSIFNQINVLESTTETSTTSMSVVPLAIENIVISSQKSTTDSAIAQSSTSVSDSVKTVSKSDFHTANIGEDTNRNIGRTEPVAAATISLPGEELNTGNTITTPLEATTDSEISLPSTAVSDSIKLTSDPFLHNAQSVNNINNFEELTTIKTLRGSNNDNFLNQHITPITDTQMQGTYNVNNTLMDLIFNTSVYHLEKNTTANENKNEVNDLSQFFSTTSSSSTAWNRSNTSYQIGSGDGNEAKILNGADSIKTEGINASVIQPTEHTSIFNQINVLESTTETSTTSMSVVPLAIENIVISSQKSTTDSAIAQSSTSVSDSVKTVSKSDFHTANIGEDTNRNIGRTEPVAAATISLPGEELNTGNTITTPVEATTDSEISLPSTAVSDSIKLTSDPFLHNAQSVNNINNFEELTTIKTLRGSNNDNFLNQHITPITDTQMQGTYNVNNTHMDLIFDTSVYHLEKKTTANENINKINDLSQFSSTTSSSSTAWNRPNTSNQIGSGDGNEAKIFNGVDSIKTEGKNASVIQPTENTSIFNQINVLESTTVTATTLMSVVPLAIENIAISSQKSTTDSAIEQSSTSVYDSIKTVSISEFNTANISEDTNRNIGRTVPVTASTITLPAEELNSGSTITTPLEAIADSAVSQPSNALSDSTKRTSDPFLHNAESENNVNNFEELTTIKTPRGSNNDHTTKDSQKELILTTNQAAHPTNLENPTTTEDTSPNNNAPHIISTTVNKRERIANDVNKSTVTENLLKINTIQQFLSSNSDVGIGTTESIIHTTVSYNEAKAILPTVIDVVLQRPALDHQLHENAESSKITTQNKVDVISGDTKVLIASNINSFNQPTVPTQSADTYVAPRNDKADETLTQTKTSRPENHSVVEEKLRANVANQKTNFNSEATPLTEVPSEGVIKDSAGLIQPNLNPTAAMQPESSVDANISIQGSLNQPLSNSDNVVGTFKSGSERIVDSQTITVPTEVLINQSVMLEKPNFSEVEETNKQTGTDTTILTDKPADAKVTQTSTQGISLKDSLTTHDSVVENLKSKTAINVNSQVTSVQSPGSRTESVVLELPNLSQTVKTGDKRVASGTTIKTENSVDVKVAQISTEGSGKHPLNTDDSKAQNLRTVASVSLQVTSMPKKDLISESIVLKQPTQSQTAEVTETNKIYKILGTYTTIKASVDPIVTNSSAEGSLKHASISGDNLSLDLRLEEVYSVEPPTTSVMSKDLTQGSTVESPNQLTSQTSKLVKSTGNKILGTDTTVGMDKTLHTKDAQIQTEGSPNLSLISNYNADKHQNSKSVNNVNSQVTLKQSEGLISESTVLERPHLSEIAGVGLTDTTAETQKPVDVRITRISTERTIKETMTPDDSKVQNSESVSEVQPKQENKFTERQGLLTNSEAPNEVVKIAGEPPTYINNGGNEAVRDTTVGVITTITTETSVKYTSLNPNKDSTDNDPKVEAPFCLSRNRGRYADSQDCTKFYICIGKLNPIVGQCPVNTVFSEIKKQCTKNKSHCVRGNEFQCLSEGRFSDILKNNAYYICVKRQNKFIRFKFQCQNGYNLNKITVRCTNQLEAINKSSTSVEEKSVSEGTSSKERKSKKDEKDDKKEDKSGEKFECKKEGKFVDPDNCRKFYVCTKTKKSEFRMRRKSCDSDELFHKDKKKCVDADSYEC